VQSTGGLITGLGQDIVRCVSIERDGWSSRARLAGAAPSPASLPFSFRLHDRVGPVSTADYRKLARRSLPKMVWAYVDGAAEDHVTERANREAFSRYALRRRALTGKYASRLSVTVAGTQLKLPIVLAPTGLTGVAHWQGECAAARGAETAGTVATVSTASSWSLEEVAAKAGRAHWFQLYPWARSDAGQHDLMASLLDRAQRSGYGVLVVTVDVPVAGNREDERRTGMGPDSIVTPARLAEALGHPRWLYGFLRHQRITMRNLEAVSGFAGHRSSIAEFTRLLRPQLCWDDLVWVREQWDGPLLVKGILEADDAERAVEIGADGVIVSNHGGRQLDGAVATLDALPAIVAQVGDRAQVLLDGGIRRGTDVIKALCLGADAVCIGRPYVHGLAAAGSDGVADVLKILRDETRRAMTLMGVDRIEDLDRSWIVPAASPLEAFRPGVHRL
jgi:isopentenyl diphosphate isomerase/L-lactate dehydrogenase-like FMN-dependent dehydrogenase